jgi:CRISPR-associated protein Csd2
MSLTNKYDFAVIFAVTNANPNGDPLNGNRPRINYEGYGEISDVCLKRKLRDRLQESGESIFVQSDDRKVDEHTSLRNRAEAVFAKKKTSDAEIIELGCKTWFDVRAFGQLFAFTKAKKDNNSSYDSLSIGIRGPVSIHSAFSTEPVSVTSTQITKSVSGEGDGTKRGSDTMGMKHRVDKGIYSFFGSINPQLSEKTGFSEEDANKIKEQLPRLFENDASSARPEGTMQVLKVIWWKHDNKHGQYSSAKVHGSLKFESNGNFNEVDLKNSLDGLKPEIIPGF